jgi:large subunit ribosomal protein L7Ae
MVGKKGKGKKVAPAPFRQGAAKPTADPMFTANKRTFGVGQALPPKRDLTRYIKWPRYVRLQRQRRVLYHRLKVPPQVAQFNHTLDKNTAGQMFALLNKYKPETKVEKKARLLDMAQNKTEGKEMSDAKKPHFVKYGINHIASLVESKKAQLVVIAHDVDPIELVIWLPALCRKQGVPFCIVKSKARLGLLVNKKTATAVALTSVRPEDKQSLAKLVEAVNANFLERYRELRKQWGGGQLGFKSTIKVDQKRRQTDREAAKRQQAL